MLESKIERAVCDYAKSKGLLVYKLSSPAHAAVPDRMMILPSGHTFFVEFKAEGKKPTPAQEREHARLRGHGVYVAVIDNIDTGKQMVDTMCAGLGL